MGFKLTYLAKRNPAVPFEEWPRTWRSHAVYVSQFPVMDTTIEQVVYCARLADSPAGFSQDYDGVALVGSPSKKALRGSMTPEVRALVDIDERRVFSTLVDEFSMFIDQAFSRGGAIGKAAAIRFLARKPGMTRADFDTRLARHGDVAAKLIAPHGPVALHVQEAVIEQPPEGYPFDAVTVSWFETPEAAIEAVNAGVFAEVDSDLAEFRDADRSVDLLTRVIHRWPRAD